MVRRETVVMDAAQTGASYAHRHYRSTLTVDTKADKTDLVTDVDRMTQRRVVETIQASFPDDTIVGEEDDERSTVPDEGHAWIIDPIDGTQNFVYGLSDWVTSVALVADGEPEVAINIAPEREECYRAAASGATLDGHRLSVSDRTDPETFMVATTLRWQRPDVEAAGRLAAGIVERLGELRRLGSAQLSLSLVAAGALDAVVGFDPEPNAWDTVAGVFQVERAGGTVTGLDGEPWTTESRGLVASNGHAHDAVLETVQNAVDE